MVQAADEGLATPAVWARRQADSLTSLGAVVDTYIFRARRSWKGLIIGGWELRQRSREFGADLIHVHFGAAQALVAVLFSPKPVVISFCGSDLLGNYHPSGRKTWMGYLSILLSQLAAVGARRCIAKTEELRQALWLSSCRNKCEVIPNGVNLNQFRPLLQSESRTILGWRHNDPVVLFMDRKGAWVKDPELAHAAYEGARGVLPGLRMHIVETEPPDRMPFFFSAADVLLLTSRHEGSNNTVKEALACNLPVVATACGDIPERLHRVSHSYVCAREPAELAACLVKVVTTRERSNGRQHVFDLALDCVALKVKQFYERTLGLSFR
jgi:glycosyltransferase involved in cell wall biosynthesis